MRGAAEAFYLAVFALLSSSHAATSSQQTCAFEPKSIVSDACASYDTLDSLNAELSPSIKAITRTTDFFGYYRLNLFNKQCPFWSEENGMCGNIACAVNTLDNEEDTPPIWRADELSKLEGPKAGHPGKKTQKERGIERPLAGQLGEGVGESCVVEFDDECDERDYCVPEDESATAKGDYVSLVDNPERFTGYAGPGAWQVWDAIYRENCFPKDPVPKAGLPGGYAPPPKGQAVNDLRVLMREHGRQQALVRKAELGMTEQVDGLDMDDECLEKRVFYRVVSGMHASISTHLCWEYLNQTTGQWGPNLECYKERLGNHPDRISNLYFNYALMVRAVAKLRGHFEDYTFCTGDPVQDRDTKEKVLRLADKAASGPPIFDETLMFQDPSNAGLKEEFRDRFRNVSRLMDCIGCDKCRLWGKLQTAGYGTALKVLFEFEEGGQDNPPLRRTELVALINTLDRLSSSLTAVKKFRKMVEHERSGGVQAERNPLEEMVESNTSSAHDEPDENEDDVPKEGLSAGETFWDEWYRIWRVWRWVFQSWVEMPRTVFEIALLELSRWWEFWLGRPVTPRSWKFKGPPSRDEI